MEVNNMENLDYNLLKKSFMIVMEINNYVVLNDGRILIKDENNKLKNAKEDDKFVKEIRSLMGSKEELNDYRRIDRLESNDEMEL